MKIEVLSHKVICSNKESNHNYFGWPTVTRLKNGKLAMAASGFRVGHICPFGKCIMCVSEDEGRTWSLPAIVIDTPLDDRDGGITAFGESGVIVTSFNLNECSFSRADAIFAEGEAAYRNSYVDMLEARKGWEKYLGPTARISYDNGITFGDVINLPVSCPHGPAEMPDGSLLCVGTDMSGGVADFSRQRCYRIFADGSHEFLCDIEGVDDFEGLLLSGTPLTAESHAIVLENGRIIVHMRFQDTSDNSNIFTIYQCESDDGGRHFSRPHRILASRGGAPAHLIDHNGVLISVYGYRDEPFGIRAMFSQDEGRTWDIDNVLVDTGLNGDIGYPASVVLNDGNILTVFYGWHEGYPAAVIQQIVWRYFLN